jgi:BirA family biotin operon repressor/biotin-[acetyl-CoA-carboxylase] ligase
LKILSFKSLPSTQLYLKNLLTSSRVSLPVAVVAAVQTEGVGSRNNSWVSKEGNLFLSFALPLSLLPKDLKLASASIYYSYILKETLEELGSKVFLKWPNDLYIGNEKIGGMITNVVGDILVCGVGLNLTTDGDFGGLDIKITKEEILHLYFKNIEKSVLWKQVFSKYKLNFQTNQNFFTHINGKRVSLGEAKLECDGSLNINGQRVYSLR